MAEQGKGNRRVLRRRLMAVAAPVGLLMAAWVLGCGGSGSVAGSTAGPRAVGSSRCVLRLGPLMARVRRSPAYRRIAAQVRKARSAEQARIDALVRAYRERYALDIRAAKFLQERAKLGRMRGVVISEAEYRERAARMEARLRADPELARAVREQEDETPEYRVRKQNAALEAARIAIRVRRAQKRLKTLASRLEAPLRRAVARAAARAAAQSLSSGRCRLVCSDAGELLGARKGEEATCGDLSGARDVTRAALRFLEDDLRSMEGGTKGGTQ